MSNTCSLNAQPLPKVLAFKLTKWDNRQNVPTTFLCISASVGTFCHWGESGTFCRLKNARQWFSYGYAPDISKICPRYAQALPKAWGFKLRGWDKMSPGKVHKLGHYVTGEVHNAVGHFVVGTFCLLTVWPKPTPYFSLFFSIQGLIKWQKKTVKNVKIPKLGGGGPPLRNFSHIIPFLFWPHS